MNMWHKVCDTFLPHARNNYTPFAVGRKSLSAYAGFMIAVKLVALFSLDLLPQSYAQASEVTSSSILQLTNYSRSVFSLSSVQLNTKLTRAAQAKAEDMIKNQYFAHNSPQGVTPWDFIKAQGYNYIISGENLALNFSSAEGVENAWMNSPGHKANILNKDFQDVGIGIAAGMYKGQKTTMVVEIFGTSVDQPFTPKLAYSKPANLVQEITQASVPIPEKVTLQSPILENPKFSLTNNKEYTITGLAPEANYVYLLVNQKPQTKLEVIQGRFTGSLNLTEGKNEINAVSFNNSKEASNISAKVIIQLDTASPIVDSAQIQPLRESGQTYYVVQIQASADAAKIIANLGVEHVLLQPGANPNVWEGRFAVNPSASVTGKLMVNAYDLAGNTQPTEIGSFAGSLQQSYDSSQPASTAHKVLGREFVYDQFNMIYLYFALFLLAVLTLAIGIKRNVQHLGLIAHTSALIAVAAVFWVT